jgi:cytochrome b561
MTLKNTPERWGGVSRFLHWLIVLLIVVMAAIGLTMEDLTSGPDKIRIYALHKSLGLTILGLMVLRVLWRLFAGAPAPVAGTPGWQHRIAGLTHLAIYALLFAMPISGWVLNSAAGFPLQWFGLFNLPHIVERSQELRELAEDMHEILFWALMFLVAVHAGAALYHHLFLGDDTLRRMLPGRRRKHTRT